MSVIETKGRRIHRRTRTVEFIPERLRIVYNDSEEVYFEVTGPGPNQFDTGSMVRARVKWSDLEDVFEEIACFMENLDKDGGGS